MLSQISEVLQRGQQQGTIRTDMDAEALAQFIFSTSQGLKVMSKNGASQTMLRNIVDVALRAIQK